MAKEVRKFLLEYCDEDEKKSYIKYIKGDKNQNQWIEKGLSQREKLIRSLPVCECGSPINIFESGVCLCSNSHPGYEVIHNIIKAL